MDDEDTIELTITKGFFKKSANYFVGVRMLGHAGKVKTELCCAINKSLSALGKIISLLSKVNVNLEVCKACKKHQKYDASSREKRVCI